ncbi:MAG TPA: DUF1566 domain-containing protein [Rhodocyclaceae bacterium]
MNAPAPTIIPAIGATVPGGFFAGTILIDDQRYGLAVPPKALGEHKPTIWIPNYKDIPGAKSFYDGLANTRAMAEAGSKLAQWALELEIDGCTDFYIPAQDEKEIIYRVFKPGTAKNSQYARSGINLSALPPTRPYSLENPAQTVIEAFQEGGVEAFEADAYWTSTQHAAISYFAWYQGFSYGVQYGLNTNLKLPARAVRRFHLPL